MWNRLRRPSPAMVLAAIALILAMAGTAIAGPDAISNKITKSKVKKIAKKQAGKVVNKREPGLNVNSAKTADTATTATTAATAINSQAVDGMSAHKISLALAAGSSAEALNAGGLTINAACSGGQVLSLTATTTVDASLGSQLTNLIAGASTFLNETQQGFAPGENVDLLAGGNPNGAQIDFEYDANNGSVVTGTLLTDEFIGGGCRVAGTALSG
jgi:hypothetical protein